MTNMRDIFKIAPLYATKLGAMYCADSLRILSEAVESGPSGKAQLIFTSPPFPLNRKKRYGNLEGEAFVNWLASCAPLYRKLLKHNGSIVIEMGNAWEPGKPVMSTLAIRALLSFLEAGSFHLCQQFICYNPARLPAPAQWVNIERIRVKDSFTHIWWMAPSTKPKADNRRVLKEYSPAMRKLLATGKYNHGMRPSEHCIGKSSFLHDNKGAIPSNVLVFSNTTSTDDYLKHCHRNGTRPHPARMTKNLPEFFIKFLTCPGDTVLDPFSGSNTTGAAAEGLKRSWISIEMNPQYAYDSRARFPELEEPDRHDQ